MALPKGQNPKELTPKQRRFIKNYCDKASPTYGNATKSYIAAGYKDGVGAPQAACKLLSNYKVCKEIVKFSPESSEITVKKREISREYTRNRLIDLADRARAKGDLPTELGCVRLMCQITGMLDNKLVVDVKHAVQMDERQRELCRQIADYTLRKGLTLQSHTQDVVCDMVNNNDDTIDAVFDDCNDSDDNDL